MNSWFRFYHEVLDDPKVQNLPGETFKVWINMLCLAARNEGCLPLLADVSFAFRMSIEETQKHVSLLVKNGLIDRSKRGILRPHNWDNRQFKSDSSTERVKRFRKRFKTVTETVNETPPEQNRTDSEQNRTEPPINPQHMTAGYSPDFEVFWNVYPKKTGKGAAWSEWRKNGHPPVKELVSKIQQAAASVKWQEDNGRYIPNPSTWLHQKRWDDEIPKSVDQMRAERDRQTSNLPKKEWLR